MIFKNVIFFVGLSMVVVDHYVVLHPEVGFVRGVIPRLRARRMSKIHSCLFLHQSLLHLFHRLIPLLHMSLVPCRLSSLFSNPVESISVCSIRIHKDTQLGTVFSFLILSLIFVFFFNFISNKIFVFFKFNKKNGITRCINQMMCFMLRKGYLTYSVMPNDERHLGFRNFAIVSKF